MIRASVDRREACSPDVRYNPKSLLFGLETKKTYVSVCPSVPPNGRSIMTRGYPRADFAGTSLASRADGFRQSAGPPSGRAGEVAFPPAHTAVRGGSVSPPRRVLASSASVWLPVPQLLTFRRPGPPSAAAPGKEKLPRPPRQNVLPVRRFPGAEPSVHRPPGKAGRSRSPSVAARKGGVSRPRASPAGNHRMPTSPPARAAFREGPQKAPGQALCYIVA